MSGGTIHFRPGDWVEARPLPEILATLDARGRLEGLPFMPEMVPYCGRRFQVYRRVEKIFLDRRNIVRRLKNTVLLAGIRCDGRSHGGCQMACLTLWKEGWLRPADAASEPTAPCRNAGPDLPTMTENRYCCQATELIHCTDRLSWWDFRQYVRDYYARKMSVRQWAGMVALLVCNKLRRACGVRECGLVIGRLEKTTNIGLDLQPGQWVQVKSRKEIEATLDTCGKNRGLGFAPEMVQFCNGRFRVLRRIEQVVLEWSGEMRQITGTVTLDGVTCTGMARRCCPRDCYHLWREVWLRRVEEGE
jgi:hypothetical protein